MKACYHVNIGIQLAIISSLLIAASCRTSLPQQGIDSVEIYSDTWDATSFVALPAKLIVEQREKTKLKIVDPTYIKKIAGRLTSLKELEPCLYPKVDTRVVCLLKSSRGIDTLSFGGLEMALNADCRIVDTLLLKLVADSLSDYNQKAIRKMLDRM